MTGQTRDDSDAAESAPRRSWTALPREVKVLLVARFVNRLGAFSLPFLATLLVTRHHVGLAGAGMVVGAFGMATIPSRLLGGRLADRRGTKVTVVTGLVATAAAQLIVATAGSTTWVALGALLLGLSFELYEPASQALVADVTPPALLPTAFGLLGAVLAVAGVVAGLVAAIVGRLDLRLLFVIDAVTCLACAALVAIWLPDTTRPPRAAGARRSPWRDPRLRLLFAVGVLFATVYVTIPVALPLTLLGRGQSPADAGLLAAAAAATVALGLPLVGTGADAVRRMVVGHVLLAAGLVLTGLSRGLWAFLGSSVVVAVGDLLLLGCSQALVAAIAPPGRRPAYFAAHGLCWGVALTVGPAAAGAVLSAAGPDRFWMGSAALVLAAGAALLLAAGRLSRSGDARETVRILP